MFLVGMWEVTGAISYFKTDVSLLVTMFNMLLNSNFDSLLVRVHLDNLTIFSNQVCDERCYLSRSATHVEQFVSTFYSQLLDNFFADFYLQFIRLRLFLSHLFVIALFAESRRYVEWSLYEDKMECFNWSKIKISSFLYPPRKRPEAWYKSQGNKAFVRPKMISGRYFTIVTHWYIIDFFQLEILSWFTFVCLKKNFIQKLFLSKKIW